ncbi:MAG TPA: nuclear transport factor 2 family protein [Pseudoduganella sp.]|jgi:ketosteroid isomerase-like protein
MNIQENKQRVMEGYKLFQAGDIQNLLGLYHENAEWLGPESEHVPFSGNFHGRAGIAEFFRKLDASVQPLHMEPRRMIAEGDTVVVIGDSTWLARNTGRQYDNPFVHIFTLRDGMVERFEGMWDTGPAERALSPELPLGQDLGKPLHH